MSTEATPIIFTPDNEPYLGRRTLLVLDSAISAMMEQNAVTAPATHGRKLTDQQHMACQVIPQAVSIALSIRELIRQGYLFGAHVLLRPLVERVAILLYLNLHPDEIDVWKRGWHQGEAPGLAKMFDAIQAKQPRRQAFRGSDLTAPMNTLLHAKPDSAPWNLVPIGEEGIGHAVSKILNRPDLCDDICANLIPWIVIIPSMMAAYFGPDGQGVSAPAGIKPLAG
jgi:hypothetical protein